jgi:hypothetical protein
MNGNVSLSVMWSKHVIVSGVLKKHSLSVMSLDKRVTDSVIFHLKRQYQ